MAISLTRLSGGNTPADGSDPRTFPAIWNASATAIENAIAEGGGASVTISTTAPLDPAEGDMWWNSDSGLLYVYYDDGTSAQWVDAASPKVFISDTAPTGYPGQLWLDSTDGSMYTYYTDPGGANAQWIGAVSRSGGILQVVSTTKTDIFTTTSSSYTDVTGLSVSITPRSTSSKILVLSSVSLAQQTSNDGLVQLVRGSTAIGSGTGGSSVNGFGMFSSALASAPIHQVALHLDSPATTSTTTYKIQVRVSGGGTVLVNRRGNAADFGTSSFLTLIEVAG